MKKDLFVDSLQLVATLFPETLLKNLDLDISKKIIKNKKNCLLTVGLCFL